MDLEAGAHQELGDHKPDVEAEVHQENWGDHGTDVEPGALQMGDHDQGLEAEVHLELGKIALTMSGSLSR